MIILIHDEKKITRIIASDPASMQQTGKSIGSALFALAEQNPNETLAWCDERAYPYFNADAVHELLHHDKMILSYNPSKKEYFSDRFGYVDDASILAIPKSVPYFTWQLSGVVGVAKAKLFNKLRYLVPSQNEPFEYLLQSLAKRLMPNGLLCYSEPKLLTEPVVFSKVSASNYTLYRFVKQHKSFKWLFVLLFNTLLYERKFHILPLIYGMCFKTRKWDTNQLDTIEVNSSKQVVINGEVDVIVPTIGRPEHLYNVLCDLRKQKHLPKQVIVVEQNPQPDSNSQLSFITGETWPFPIDHTFTHQPGACNARNIALSKVRSEWVFMCDDDNRFEGDLIEKVLLNARQYGAEVLLTAYPRTNTINPDERVHQTTIFGSGNAFLKSNFLKEVRFDMNYEFCYGEDFDFGMQLRSIGADVLFFPTPVIVHLKAPMGGFRIKPVYSWSNDTVRPSPSPTIILNYLKYRTTEQFRAYKTLYIFKSQMKKGVSTLTSTLPNWNASVHWAKKLWSNKSGVAEEKTGNEI